MIFQVLTVDRRLTLILELAAFLDPPQSVTPTQQPVLSFVEQKPLHPLVLNQISSCVTHLTALTYLKLRGVQTPVSCALLQQHQPRHLLPHLQLLQPEQQQLLQNLQLLLQRQHLLPLLLHLQHLALHLPQSQQQ